MTMSDALMRRLGTWKTAGEPGRARAAKPREINGLQAHAILHHDVRPNEVFTSEVPFDVALFARWHGAMHHNAGVRHV